MRVTLDFNYAAVIVVKDLSCLGRTKFARCVCCINSHPRGGICAAISSQSRYPDFEGKRRKLTDNARVCKPLKNRHFSALEGRKSQKPRQSKEFERNPVLGRKKPVGEKMGRTRGEITVQCR